MSTEIVIDLAGKVHAGRPPIVDPSGQMPLTGLGIVLVLEWLALSAIQSVRALFPEPTDRSRDLCRSPDQCGGQILDLKPIAS